MLGMAAPGIGVRQNSPARPGMPRLYLPDYPQLEEESPPTGGRFPNSYHYYPPIAGLVSNVRLLQAGQSMAQDKPNLAGSW